MEQNQTELVVLTPKELAIQALLPREAAAYRYFCNSKLPPLAPITQAKLFELYLNGCSCEEIRRLNPAYGLGMIVHAKIEGLWDKKKTEHTEDLLVGIRERVQNVSLESVHFISDLISSAHKQFGDRLKRYIQTGDEKELGDLSIDTLTKYKAAIELLQKMTGQDKEKRVEGNISVTHTMVPAAPRPVTPSEASQILKDLDVEFTEKK